MKLNFEILWFEDEYTPQQDEQIKNYAAESGFDAIIDHIEGNEKIPELSSNQDIYHKYDLVLIDLNLLDDVKGHDRAVEIRKSFKFTPILFYSSGVDEDKLRSLINEAKVDGVYFTDRKKLINRTGELIKDFAHSLNRLSGMRGLAAQIVAEIGGLCEHMIIELVENDQDKVNKDIDAKLRKQFKENINKIERFKNLEDRLNSPMVDSSKTFRLYIKLVEQKIQKVDDSDIEEKLTLLQRRIENYQEDVLSIRNIFAHAREVEGTNGLEIFDSRNNKTFSVRDFPEIRRKFIRYLESIREIEEIFKEYGLIPNVKV